MLVPLTQSVARPAIAAIQASGGGGGTFDPSSIAGLQLWLKADTGVQKDDGSGGFVAAASGDLVSRWLDQSGNGKHATQPNAGSRPSYEAGSVSGVPEVVNLFNASGVGMSIPLSLSVPFTVIWCEAPTAIGMSRRTLNSNGANCEASLARTDYTVYLEGVVSQNIAPVSTSPAAGSIVSDLAVSARFWMNGTEYTNGATTHSWPSFCIGASPLWPSEPAQSRLAELVVYNSALSSTDRGNVEHYLSTKYALGF